MKQIIIQKSKVYLSTYDESDTLLPVTEEHKSLGNICVAVKFGDIVVKISPRNICKCTWNKAMENHSYKLMSPAFWQMVGVVYQEVNQAIEMLGHDPLNWVWTNTQYSGYLAWYYYGPDGFMDAISKDYSYSVREAKVLTID